MAKKKKTKAEAPKPQGSDRKGGSEGLLHGLLTVLLSILVVVVVFGGAFYYVLKNNIYGMGEQFRPRLQKVPVLRHALPPLPETEDPDDPKYLTQKELIDKYNALRSQISDLAARLEEANLLIRKYEGEKEQADTHRVELEAEKQHNEETLKQIEKQTAQLEQDKKELSRLIAEGDPGGFTEYFQKIEPQAAQEIYQQLISEDIVNQELKTLAKTYESMDEANAANIMTELGNKDMPLLLDLIGSMKPVVAAKIIENMEQGFAADLLRSLADRKLSMLDGGNR
jgi:flagellar motility protein MotE (MotC chaperone)